MVTDDMLEIYALMDKTLNNNLLEKFPTIEQAALANFNYLFPNGFTTAYGDAKHRRLRFNSLELLVSNYRKYGKLDKEALITGQLKRFIQDGAYSRTAIHSLFHLFFYVDELKEIPPAASFASLVNPTFYSPNVSWVVQRNEHSLENGMMVSKNASLGNHSHTNGVNIELFAKGMVIAPDCAAGVSYWTTDHRDYYSRFAAHNTVVVDGISDYRNMRGTQAFEVNAIYPATDAPNPLYGDLTLSDVTFNEPSTDATQKRITGTIRTGETTGYFVDIFRSSRNDGKDKKHEYLWHSQGEPIVLKHFTGEEVPTIPTDELSSAKGDLVGYDYFKNKRSANTNNNFIAQFKMPSILGDILQVNLWMKGNKGREIFSVEAPYSRAINKESVPKELYQKALPTLVVRQNGEARTRPFVAIVDAFNESEGKSVKKVDYFYPRNRNPEFVGVSVRSLQDRLDLIFNDENPTSNHLFDEGEFQGRFGLITKVGDVVNSMLLVQGKVLTYEQISIVMQEKPGDVLIKLSEGSIEIDAAQPFSLTIPLDEKTIGQLAFIGQNDKEAIKGKVVQKDKQRWATFELPTLNRVRLKLL